MEVCLAALENAKHGFAFASGLGATTVLTSLLKAGDHIVSGDDIYGGTNRFFQKCLSMQNIEVTFADVTDANNVIDAIKPNTKVLIL